MTIIDILYISGFKYFSMTFHDHFLIFNDPSILDFAFATFCGKHWKMQTFYIDA